MTKEKLRRRRERHEIEVEELRTDTVPVLREARSPSTMPAALVIAFVGLWSPSPSN
ncbi:hypothetical protein [Jannaschia sp. LMIT008]|uniref:hypothetical protein n=1 Tax=Jannaschia maritima TaxID=3032585 RepID=UPI002811D8DA|nr:hypothetical protein [Jannaschia sp. LMIT008]